MGYCGGTTANPTYQEIGDHTESLQITYDPRKLSFEKLLEVFDASHNCSQQGWGTQYKNVLFVHDDAQQRAARDWLQRARYKHGVVHTEIVRMGTFTRAEEYHQKYRLKNHDALKRFLAQHPLSDDKQHELLEARLNAFLGGNIPLEQVMECAAQLDFSDAAREALRRAALTYR